MSDQPVTDLDALVTPDEPLWVTRYANFFEAISSGNFEDTYQAAHPGVTTMWLATIAYRISDHDLPDRMDGQTTASDIRQRVIPSGERPIDVLVQLRKAMIIANAIIVLALFFTLGPLVGRWASFAATAYLSLDPMQIGFTRLLHLDGLSSGLLLLAVISWFHYLQRGSRVGLILSAIAAGLALQWLSPFGPLKLSIANPLNKKDGDQVQRLQFTFGTGF